MDDMVKQFDGIGKDFKNIQSNFNDHLETINENTQEIESNAEHLHCVEQKIEKLNARLDSMHMLFKQLLMKSNVKVELNLNEQKIFSLLSSYKNYLKMSYVCERTRLAKDDITNIITSLMDKGIPVVRKVTGGDSFLRLDPEFNELQQRLGLIKISPTVQQQFANQQLGSFFG